LHISEASRRLLWRAGLFAVLAASVLPYLPALGGNLIWDDRVLVSGQAIGGGKRFTACFTEPFLGYYYRPMVSASFFIDRLFWKNIPFGYHQTNILLHLLTSVALAGLLLTSFRRRSIALLGALLFAVQPAQVSTVAWIGGRTDSLCALFVVLFAWALVAGLRNHGRDRTLLLAGSVLAYAVALFTKEQVIALLPLIPLAAACFLPKEARTGARGPIVKTLTAAVAVSAFFVLLWVFLGPPRPAFVASGLPAILAQGGRTITYYTLLLLAPSAKWIHTFCLGNLEQGGWWPVAAGYAVLAGTLTLLLRWRFSPQMWFLALCASVLLPVSNFVPMPSLLVAPYRAGIAGVGAAALLAWMVCAGLDRLRAGTAQAQSAPGRVGYRLAQAAGCALVLWSAGVTAWGTRQWKDEETVFRTIVTQDPHSIIARVNLATALLQAHRHDEAITHLEAMLTELFGSDAWRRSDTAKRAWKADRRIVARVRQNQGNRVEPEQWVSVLYGQLGSALLDADEIGRAKEAFRVGIGMDLTNAVANSGLAHTYHLAGDYKTAIHYLKRAAAADPRAADPHAELGQIYAELGRWADARTQFAACIKAKPWVGQAYLDMAKAQTKLGDRAGAAATLRAALANAPARDDVRRMLATL
jgi:protein O-mannosyl-transferase